MTSLLRSSVFAIPLFTLSLGIAACTTGAAEDADVASNDLSTEVGRAFEGTEQTITIEVGGAGLMPAGSACVPGSAIYNWNGTTSRLDFSRCVAGPDGLLHTESATGYTSENAPLGIVATRIARADFDAFIVALRQVPISRKATCDVGAKEAIKLTTRRADNSFSTYYDDFYACEAIDANEGRVSNVGPVLEQLRLIASRLPFTSSLPTAPVATIGGRTLWEEAADFSIENKGAGEVPLGSECAPGSEYFYFNAQYKRLSWTECLATTAVGARLRKVRHDGTLDDADIAAFRAAAQAAVTTATPTCEAKPLVSIVRSMPGSIRAFVNEASACRSYSNATTNVDGVLAALRSITH